MSFSDNLTEQQRADCVLARGMDFDVYCQRMVDSIESDAKIMRIKSMTIKLQELQPGTALSAIEAAIDAEFEKVK